jgi:hypothetical protein
LHAKAFTGDSTERDALFGLLPRAPWSRARNTIGALKPDIAGLVSGI